MSSFASASSAVPGFPRRFRQLRKGDRVAVVAPSSPVQRALLELGLDELRDLGLEPVMRDDIGAKWRFTAGDDGRRLAELNWALTDASMRAVWVARGGHGTLPLLRGLDADALRRDPKPIVGESDATALGCWALVSGVAWLHGPMVATALRQGPTGFDRASLAACLFDGAGPGTMSAPGGSVLRAGHAEGVAWGGCLSLLASLAGTPWLPRIPGAVFVAEDVGVKPYQVHRMLVQLREAGAFEGIGGVVLGDFSDCIQHPDQGYRIDDVLGDFFRDIDERLPVTIGWPVGHARAAHLTLPMGTRVRLEAEAGQAPRLTWLGAPSDGAEAWA